MNRVAEAIRAMGGSCTEEMLAQMEGYMDGVLAWNEKVNLTAITDKDEFLVKHLIDSVLAIPYEPYLQARRVIDVGTGAGFPGVPLAILSPDKEFLLMDSLSKRLKIIDQLTGEIALKNIKTLHGRAEEVAQNKAHRESYDLCVSRAVANLAVLAEYCLPFIKEGGYLLAYKGPDAEKEIQDAARAIEILGGQVEMVKGPSLENFDLNHKIVFIKKIKKTPFKYPRKAGTPA